MSGTFHALNSAKSKVYEYRVLVRRSKPALYQGRCHYLPMTEEDLDRTSLEKANSEKDLIQNGEIELRQWITLMGIVGSAKPEFLVYEPFYRGVLGMAVGYWDLAP